MGEPHKTELIRMKLTGVGGALVGEKFIKGKNS